MSTTQLPQRLALGPGPQVPDRVDERRRRQVDDALLGPDPAQVRVAGELAPEAARIAGDVGQPAALDEMRERVDRGHHDLGAAPDRERHAVAAQIAVGLEDHVRGRVVRRLVHRIRAGERARGREAHVADVDGGDPAILHSTFPYPQPRPRAHPSSFPVRAVGTRPGMEGSRFAGDKATVPARQATCADVLGALTLVTQGRVYNLDCGRFPGMPIFPGHRRATRSRNFRHSARRIPLVTENSCHSRTIRNYQRRGDANGGNFGGWWDTGATATATATATRA